MRYPTKVFQVDAKAHISHCVSFERVLKDPFAWMPRIASFERYFKHGSGHLGFYFLEKLNNIVWH